jgi:cytochrome c oxidase cbb3-type subunit III
MTIRSGLPPRRPPAAWLLAPVLLLAAAPSAPAPAAPTQGPGERLYLRECASCHGPRGEGGRGPTLAVPRLARARDRAALLDIVEDGIDGTEMPDAHLQPREAKLVADWVLALGRRPVQKVPGDPARGQALYFGKAGCALCHTIGGEGGAVGGDLTDIGARRGAGYLSSALTDPEASLPVSSSPYRADINITENFLLVRLVTRAREEIIGVRVNEDTFSIQIRDVSNRVRSFWKSELAELDKMWGRSPMPSYAEALTTPELQDLVAYLSSLRGTR